MMSLMAMSAGNPLLLAFVVLIVLVQYNAASDATQEGRLHDNADSFIPQTPKDVLRAFYRKDNSYVLDLQENNFKMAMDNYQATIVYFYTPNCRLCKNLGPAYEKAAEVMFSRRLPEEQEIAFARVDINDKRVIAEHFDIKYVPALRIFPRKNYTGYVYDSYLGRYDHGARTVLGLVNKAMALAGIPHVPTDTYAELRTLRDVWLQTRDDFVLMSFFNNISNGTKEAGYLRTISNIVQQDRNFTSAISVSPMMADKFKVTPPAVVMLKNFDEARVDMPQDLFENQEGLTQWIKSNAVPNMLMKYTDSRSFKYRRVFQSDYKNFLMYFGNASDTETYEKNIKDIQVVCAALAKESPMRTACIDMVTSEQEEVFGLQAFANIKSADLPQVILFTQNRSMNAISKISKYQPKSIWKMGKEITQANVREFALNAEKGPVFRRTSEVTETMAEAIFPVVELTRMTFESKFNKEWADKYVLMRFQSSHFFHVCSDGTRCPYNSIHQGAAYTKFAKLASGLDNFVCSEIDTRLNDLTETTLDGAITDWMNMYMMINEQGPALVLFAPGQRNNGILYHGDQLNMTQMREWLVTEGLTGAASIEIPAVKEQSEDAADVTATEESQDTADEL